MAEQQKYQSDAEVFRFESYITTLEKAFSSGNDGEQMVALNPAAAKIIKYRTGQKLSTDCLHYDQL